MPQTTFALEGNSLGKHLPVRTPPVDTGSQRREEACFEICEGMIDIAAALFNVSSRALRSAGRTASDVSRVRQIAMYVSHVTLGLTMKEVGLGFARDRTTVMHSCHLIEDMRDDSDFDRVVVMTERVAVAAFRGRLEVLR